MLIPTNMSLRSVFPGLACLALLVTAIAVPIHAGEPSTERQGIRSSPFGTSEKLSEEDLESLFRDNTSDPIFTGTIESELVSVINKYLKPSFAKHDISLLEPALSTNFERTYLLSSGEVSIESKAEFLKKRKSWQRLQPDHRRLSYHIRGITIADPESQAIVTALATYRTKYFVSRFLEVLTLDQEPEWKIRSQNLFPLRIKNWDDHEVAIIVTPIHAALSSWLSTPSERLEAIQARGPDNVIEQIRKADVQSIPGNEKLFSVLYVFRESPAVGTKIRTEHQFWRPWAKRLSPYKFNYDVQSSEPFFVIENRVRAGGKGGHITFKVFVDFELVGKRRIDIQ